MMHVMGMDVSKYGGLERFNVSLAAVLRERGMKGVFVYESKPSAGNFEEDMATAGGELVVCNSRRDPVRFSLRLARLISRYRPVIVHSHFTKARFYAVPVALMMGVRRQCFTMHSELEDKSSIKPLTKMWYSRANKIAGVLTVSGAIKQQYLDIWPNASVDCIHLGVSEVTGNRQECRKRLGVRDDDVVVLTIANFNHIKGLDVLCEAIARVLGENDNLARVDFYVVGQPQKDIEQLSRLARKLGIEDNLHLIGVSNNVCDYLCAADIYVQPSRNEGISMSLMEAASASLPLVGSRVGGIPEVIAHGENGLLVEPGDADQLASALCLLATDIKMRQRMGQSSLDVYSRKYSLPSATGRLLDYYSSLIADLR